MDAKTIIITGASDGIGATAARHLAAMGHRVIVVGRSPGKTAAVADEIGADHFIADYARLDDVRRLADQLLAHCPTIDVLANNAGGLMSNVREETVDGHEKTLQVNHLAPFLLTTLLLDRLIADKARVLNTASIANSRFSKLRIDDLDARRGYSSSTAYGNAKLANILFTKELVRRHGIRSAAFHPGDVATNFAAGSNNRVARLIFQSSLKHVLLTSPERGADTLHWLTISTDWTSGEYYCKRKPAKPHPMANDADLARELWDHSAAMVSASAPR